MASNESLLASELFRVDGFKAVITGGGTGIGLMITQAIVANGGTAYICGRREEPLKKVAELYSGKGSSKAGQVIPMTCDVTSKDDVYRLASEIGSKEPSGIHLLVNNAGIAIEKDTAFSDKDIDFSSAESLAKHLSQAKPEQWNTTFETNITAQFFTSIAFLPLLAKGTVNTLGYSSSVVNITSIAGLLKTCSTGQFAYATSKAGLIHLTRMLASTFAKCKVRVNSIAPGLFPSEMTTGESDDKQKSYLHEKGKNLPAQRTGDDRDIAAAILYLVGPGALFVNGQILHPDGGNLLISPSVI